MESLDRIRACILTFAPGLEKERAVSLRANFEVLLRRLAPTPDLTRTFDGYESPLVDAFWLGYVACANSDAFAVVRTKVGLRVSDRTPFEALLKKIAPKIDLKRDATGESYEQAPLDSMWQGWKAQRLQVA